MPRIHGLVVSFLAIVLPGAAIAGDGFSFLGPFAYTSEADSPLKVGAVGVCLEDFEDGVLDLPAVSGNGTVVGPASNVDSVDGDDGAIDGSGIGGHSYFNNNGAGGITFEFDFLFGNGLPNTVGIVWTDGGSGAPVTFEAFDFNGDSIGVSGPHMHADGSNNGGTAEDRFYGIQADAGIAKIKISNTSGGIEVDHLQFDNCFNCGEATGDLQVQAADSLFILKAAVGTAACALCVCDVNESGGTTAVDALLALKFAVGQPVILNCPQCVPTE